MGVSQFRESVKGKCCDISYVTNVVVFIIRYFHKLYIDKHKFSTHEKLLFKLTNIICVIKGTSQTGSRNNFCFPTDYHSHGRDLGTL